MFTSDADDDENGFKQPSAAGDNSITITTFNAGAQLEKGYWAYKVPTAGLAGMVRAIITPNHDTANVKNVFSFDLEFPANLLATDTIVVEFPTFDTDNVMLTNPAEMFEDDLGTDFDNGEEIA